MIEQHAKQSEDFNERQKWLCSLHNIQQSRHERDIIYFALHMICTAPLSLHCQQLSCTKLNWIVVLAYSNTRILTRQMRKKTMLKRWIVRCSLCLLLLWLMFCVSLPRAHCELNERSTTSIERTLQASNAFNYNTNSNDYHHSYLSVLYRHRTLFRARPILFRSKKFAKWSSHVFILF